MVKKEETTDSNEIIVLNPVVFTPQVRPDVVSKLNGWDNPEQEVYAKLITDFAYQFPVKWSTRKDELVQRLKDLGNK